MKFKVYIFAFIFVWANNSYAQNCQNPVNNVVYQSQFNQVASQASNQQKLDKALGFINNGCYMSQQVKNIALLFTEDSYRLDFCKAAYSHTFDQVNFSHKQMKT